MKTGLAVAGLLLTLWAAYLIARGKMLPNTSGTQPNGGTGRTPAARPNLAGQLLTSANIGALSGLVTSFNGPAAPAPVGGKDNSGFVTTLD